MTFTSRRRRLRRPWTVHPSWAFVVFGSLALIVAFTMSLRQALQPTATVDRGPVSILLTADRDWDGPEGRQLVRYLSRGFGFLENVTEVRSLTQPLGRPLADADGRGLFAALQWTGPDDGFVNPRRLAREQFLAVPGNGHGPTTITRLDITLGSDPAATESLETLRAIELMLGTVLQCEAGAVGPVRGEVLGPTVAFRECEMAVALERARSITLAAVGLCSIDLAFALRLFDKRDEPNTAPPHILRMPLPTHIRVA